LFPDVSAYFGKQTAEGNVLKNAADISMYILNKANVSTVQGDAFGDDNCIRISFAAADEKLVEAVSRIKAALAELH
jgi:aspartate aminotransferase